MKAATAGTNNRIRIAAGSPTRATSEGASENGERSKGTEEPTSQDSRVARRDGADNTVVVYGPRRGNHGDEEDEKVKATRGPSAAERLIVTFHYLDLKGKGKGKCKDDGKDDGTERMQEVKQDDEACEMDIDG